MAASNRATHGVYASGSGQNVATVAPFWSDENLIVSSIGRRPEWERPTVHSGEGPYHPEPVSHLNDQDLAGQAALGDRFAFAEIFHRHAAAMFRYAVHMLDGDIDQAEDAVQEALTQAWVHLPQFRGDSALQTWLFRIIANSVLSAYASFTIIINARFGLPLIPIADTIRDLANKRLSQLLGPIAHPSPRSPWPSTSKTSSRRRRSLTNPQRTQRR